VVDSRNTVVSVDNLHKSFHGTEVLRGINFELHFGEVVVVIGRSGGGKSTLLRCICGLEPFDQGVIQVGDVQISPSSHSRSELAQQVGMIFQNFNLFPHLNATQNVAIAPVKVLKVNSSDARTQAEALLTKVGLAHRMNAYPAQLSGGEQQRVAIARALAMHPKVMLFDEPTSALDPETVGAVLENMRELSREGMSMIVVTHEIGFAREVADRVLFVDGGLVIEEGAPSMMLESPKELRTQEFLQSILQ
jgi:polar amino acid transport system ATP-binding protein